MFINDMSVLVGQTISRISPVEKGTEAFLMVMDNGKRYGFYHMQDCCETVEIEDVVGDIADLIGSPLVRAEERSQKDDNACESGTWTFYELATNKGSVTIRWYGSSNGYYSESVDFIALAEGEKFGYGMDAFKMIDI
jgi:hypothetical protein